MPLEAVNCTSAFCAVWRLGKASVQFGVAALFHRPAVRGAVVIACIAAASKVSQSLDEDITMSCVRSFSIE